MTTPAAPPLPRELVERLRDRPDCLEILQQALDKAIREPSGAVPTLERAMWALEDALGTFVDTARAELDAARASGDSDAVGCAQALLVRMLHASHISDYRFGELREYLKRRTEVGS